MTDLRKNKARNVWKRKSVKPNYKKQEHDWQQPDQTYA